MEKIKALNKLFFKSPIGLSQKQPVTLTNRSAALEALASYLSMESASVTKLLKQELLEPLFPCALCTVIDGAPSKSLRFNTHKCFVLKIFDIYLWEHNWKHTVF